jgi:glycosyltransferase involved in cell wall biosynthesis
MPEISIIITAYKDRGWIDDAILSAKNQTFKDYDILFASDGNPELEEYATRHGIPFYLSPKGNYSTLVNNAVRQVSGTWLKILHDDDLLTPNCLEDLYNARGECDLVYANAICFSGNDKETATQFCPPESVTFRTLLPIITNPVNFEAELIKKETFLNIGGFDPFLGYAEDYELLLNLLTNNYKIRYCDSYVVWYRHHDRQITGNEPEMRSRERDYLISKYMNVIVNSINWEQ